MTLHNNESKKCNECNIKQSLQDSKRQNRNRNYKNENLKNLNIYYKRYISSAIKRGYSMELQFEDFKEIVKKSCYYCDYKNNNEVNGIDRVDNTKGYTKENCVASCEICNKIKYNYDLYFFIEKCQIISKQKEPTEEFYKKWHKYYYKVKPQNYKNYKNLAENKRGLKFNITLDQWNKITQETCYLCGY